MTQEKITMDDMHQEFFGYKPKKRGAGYELIVTYVLQHLNEAARLKHNWFIKSSYGDSVYQLDAVMDVNNKNVVIEAKDYQGRKISRDAILKLSGAMLVLDDIDGAVYASSSEYTLGAKKYPSELKEGGGKAIDLYIIRRIEEKDLRDRIREIDINMRYFFNDWHTAEFDVRWTSKAKEILGKLGYHEGDSIGIRISCIYDENGVEIESLQNLTRGVGCNPNYMVSKGKWQFEKPSFLILEKALIPFEYISYEVQCAQMESMMKIEYNPKIYVKSVADDEVDIVISLEELKKAKKKVEENRAKSLRVFK